MDQQSVTTTSTNRLANYVGRIGKLCNNILLEVQFDPVTCIREGDYTKAVKPSNIKVNYKLVNSILHEPIANNSTVQKILHICDIVLSILILGHLIYSIVEFALKQGPLGYIIACLIIFSTSSVVASLKLGYSIYSYWQKVQHRGRIEPQGTTDTQNQHLQRTSLISTLKKLALNSKLGHEIFIYGMIICGLYRSVNERSWRFHNTLARFGFIAFVLGILMDGWQTKCKIIFLVIRSLYHNMQLQDNWKAKLKKYLLPSLSVMSHVIFLALMHWLIIAIIGVRIYVDSFSRDINETRIYTGNFSKEIDQANTSDTGDYDITSYTVYMIICGAYLPVASVIVFTVLNRAWLSDGGKSQYQKIFYCFVDPIAYIVVPSMMVPFIAFCVGIFLPDYDSSEYEVDSDAQSAAIILGVAFIAIFLLCNVWATLIFMITVIVIGVIITIICLIVPIIFIVVVLLIFHWTYCWICDLYKCGCNETGSATQSDTNLQPRSNPQSSTQLRSIQQGIRNPQIN